MKKHLILIVIAVALILTFTVACDSGNPETTQAETTATEAHTTIAGEATVAAETTVAAEITTAPETAAAETTVADTSAEVTAAEETNAAAPVKVIKSKVTICNFADKSEAPDINGSDGWNFTETPCSLKFSDGKLVVSDLKSAFLTLRLDLTGDQRDLCDYEAADAADAIGFYIENNSTEAIGVCYFGEISLPDMNDLHQQTYKSTFFSQIECYLIDEKGNITKGREYFPFDVNLQDNGLCEIPAGFKGYYVCTLETLGHDQCIYGAWGGHSVADCHDGKYVKGSSIANVGFSIANSSIDDTAKYVIGEYVLIYFE